MRFLLFVIVLSAFLNINAQPRNMSIGKFFLAVNNDRSIEAQQERIQFLQNSSKNMPVIDDIEIRIRNEAFEFNRQRYTLRVDPRGFGETKASKGLHTSNLLYHTQRKKLIVNRLLVNRYGMVVELFYRESMIELKKKLEILYEDRTSVQKNQSGSLDFDLKEVVKAEDELTKIKFLNIERERNINRLRKDIDYYMQGEKFLAFDTINLVNVQFIDDLVEKTVFTLDTNNVYLKNNWLELQLAESRFNLETAQSRRIISFFEFSYDHAVMSQELQEADGGEKDDKRHSYMMRVGARLPFINVDRHDIQRRKMAYLSDKENYEELKLVLNERLNKDTEDIKVLVSQYNFLLARREDVNSKSSLKQYLQMDGVDPLILLSIQESMLKNDIELEQIKFDILKNYIRILDITGQLMQKPLRNYLSSNQEIISK